MKPKCYLLQDSWFLTFKNGLSLKKSKKNIKEFELLINTMIR